MIQIFPKIENQEGFDNIREILEVADGVMVARGDLGVDVSLELVPIYQKTYDWPQTKLVNQLSLQHTC